MEIRRIKGIVKDYAWGNKDFIPSLIGGYTDKPQAELWLGTHPAGDAVLDDGSKLSSLIYSDKSFLGKDWNRFSGHLPLLMKILAIDKPLSLQCHPDKAQAVSGWNREAEARAKGEPCSYSDDNPKCEMFLALSPVTAMCGFRPLEVIKADLAAIVPSSYGRTIMALSSSIKNLFMSLFALDGNEKKIILEELASSLSASTSSSWDGLFMTREGVARKCLSEHPGDIGCIFPYLLNIVHLRIGEALPIVPDTLHAYVYGNGVELMSSSDNVLRGGLTKKRVDLEELKRIMEFTSLDVEKVKKINDEKGREIMLTDTPSFRLAKMDSGTYRVHNEAGIVIVIDGSLTIKEKESVLKLEKGEVAFISYSADAELSLSGLAFEAIVPPLS